MGLETLLHLYIRGRHHLNGLPIHSHTHRFHRRREEPGYGQLILRVSLVLVRECDLLDILPCGASDSVRELPRGNRKNAANELCRSSSKQSPWGTLVLDWYKYSRPDCGFGGDWTAEQYRHPEQLHDHQEQRDRQHNPAILFRYILFNCRVRGHALLFLKGETLN